MKRSRGEDVENSTEGTDTRKLARQFNDWAERFIKKNNRIYTAADLSANAPVAKCFLLLKSALRRNSVDDLKTLGVERGVWHGWNVSVREVLAGVEEKRLHQQFREVMRSSKAVQASSDEQAEMLDLLRLNVAPSVKAPAGPSLCEFNEGTSGPIHPMPKGEPDEQDFGLSNATSVLGAFGRGEFDEEDEEEVLLDSFYDEFGDPLENSDFESRSPSLSSNVDEDSFGGADENVSFIHPLEKGSRTTGGGDKVISPGCFSFRI